jgi:hypothetical protein
MKPSMTRSGLGSLALIGALVMAACSGSPVSSLSPTGPSSAAAGSTAFSPNPATPPTCELPLVLNPETQLCELPPPPPPPGDQGCTPGYWKANVKKGAGEWAAALLSPGQTVASAGFVSATYGTSTLLQALEFGGGNDVSGATQILLRAAVAALLNAANPTVEYPRSAGAIVADVNAAIAGGDRAAILALASALDGDNNLGCPLSNSGK